MFLAIAAVLFFANAMRPKNNYGFAVDRNIDRILQCEDSNELVEDMLMYTFGTGVDVRLRRVAQFSQTSFEWRSYEKRSEIDNTSSIPFSYPDFNTFTVTYGRDEDEVFGSVYAGYLFAGNDRYIFFRDIRFAGEDVLAAVLREAGGDYQTLNIDRFNGRVFFGVGDADRLYHPSYVCQPVSDKAEAVEFFQDRLREWDLQQEELFNSLEAEMAEQQRL